MQRRAGQNAGGGCRTLVTRAGALLVAAVIAAPAHGQAANEMTCGALKAEASRTASTSRWTISGPSGSTTETGMLRSGPRFECIDGAILAVEFTSSAGYSFFAAYFPDGTDIGYGRQQIDRRGSRFVLPIQAKARIAPPFRAAFDYHCRLDMPADPILPATRTDCIF
jgi:hypothetical protein